MKMTKEILAIMQGNEWLHGRNLKLQNELDEKKIRIVQLQAEVIELKKQNNDLHQAFFGEQNVCKGGWKVPVDIRIRGVHYVLADECEKLNNTIRELKRKLEQIKELAIGKDDYC